MVTGTVTGQTEKDAQPVKEDIKSETSPKQTYGADKRFKDAGDGVRELKSGFDQWTELLANKSLHASYAVIGAAWAVFGTADQLIGNFWGMLAVLMAVSFIGFTVLVNFVVVVLYRKQCKYSQRNPEEWEREYQGSGDPKSHWPYTRAIEGIPMPYNIMKLILPLAAVLFLAFAIVSSLGSAGDGDANGPQVSRQCASPQAQLVSTLSNHGSGSHRERV